MDVRWIENTRRSIETFQGSGRSLLDCLTPQELGAMSVDLADWSPVLVPSTFAVVVHPTRLYEYDAVTNTALMSVMRMMVGMNSNMTLVLPPSYKRSKSLVVVGAKWRSLGGATRDKSVWHRATLTQAMNAAARAAECVVFFDLDQREVKRRSSKHGWMLNFHNPSGDRVTWEFNVKMPTMSPGSIEEERNIIRATQRR